MIGKTSYEWLSKLVLALVVYQFLQKVTTYEL